MWYADMNMIQMKGEDVYVVVAVCCNIINRMPWQASNSERGSGLCSISVQRSGIGYCAVPEKIRLAPHHCNCFGRFTASHRNRRRIKVCHGTYLLLWYGYTHCIVTSVTFLKLAKKCCQSFFCVTHDFLSQKVLPTDFFDFLHPRFF